MATVSVRRQFVSEGKVFYPQGFNMRTLLPNDPVAFSHYTPEHRAMLASFGANTLRFQVSQSHIVDEAPDAIASYLRTISSVVDAARGDGFIVIVSCQHEDPAGTVRRPVPVAATLDFWSTIVPVFHSDHGVMFDVYNEPGFVATAEGWHQWKHGGKGPAYPRIESVGHQQLLNHIRDALGARNVVILEGCRNGGQTGTLAGVPRITDPANNTAFEVHKYHFETGREAWDHDFGHAAHRGQGPVIVGEWSWGRQDCGTPKAASAGPFLRYCRAHGVGVLGHHGDNLVSTDADGSYCDTGKGSAWLYGFSRWMLGQDDPHTGGPQPARPPPSSPPKGAPRR